MLHGLACRSRRGPRPGHRCTRVAQEPGRPCGSISKQLAWGSQTRKLQARRSASDLQGETKAGAREWYCQPKDKEGRQDGPQGVGTPSSTCEGGERTQWGPRGGKGAWGQGIVGGKHERDPEL